ncbi:MAG: SufD family Fe-S cluster assembly protein [Candidatus Humimicrobiaceae bacterium]
MSVDQLIKEANIHTAIHDKNTARLIINKDKIIDTNEVEGLKVNAREIEDGVDIDIKLEKNTVVESPVHLCFGVTHKKAVQKIIINIDIGENSKIDIFSHCVFPNAVDVKHVMDGKIKIGKNAHYSYTEKHIHSEEGGITVIPKARIILEENARLKTLFELIKGRVGSIDIDYETTCKENSVMEMTAKIDGKGDDVIKIREAGNLIGKWSRGVLTSKVAVRDNANAEIYNKLVATAEYARGHVDCKEIIQGNGVASAIPIVEVSNPKAHITHEASIGSVDSKQLQTLMSRGLSEDRAVELIIEGLLS